MSIVLWVLFAILMAVAVIYGLKLRSHQHIESSLKLKRAAERYEEKQRQLRGYGE